MTRPKEQDYASQTAYCRALETYCDDLQKNICTKDMELTVVHGVIDEHKKELADTKLLATDNANWFDALKVDYDKLKVELAAIKNQEPIGYAINVFGFDGSVIRKTPLAQDFVPVYATAGAKEKTE